MQVRAMNAEPPEQGLRRVGACVTPAELLALSLAR